MSNKYRIPQRQETRTFEPGSNHYNTLSISSIGIQSYLAKNIRHSKDALDLHVGLIFMDSTEYQSGVYSYAWRILVDSLNV